MYWTYRKLKHSGLKMQLGTIIEVSASLTQRFCAIQVAHACTGCELSGLLADLALTETEPLSLRTEAAFCVADHGAETDKARLLPLALEKSNDVDQERLKAHSLSAVWPKHCTWAQLKGSLCEAYPQTTTDPRPIPCLRLR